MTDSTTSPARQKATNTYRQKALANIALVISHTEPHVLDALNQIMAHKDCSQTLGMMPPMARLWITRATIKIMGAMKPI